MAALMKRSSWDTLIVLLVSRLRYLMLPAPRRFHSPAPSFAHANENSSDANVTSAFTMPWQVGKSALSFSDAASSTKTEPRLVPTSSAPSVALSAVPPRRGFDTGARLPDAESEMTCPSVNTTTTCSVEKTMARQLSTLASTERARDSTSYDATVPSVLANARWPPVGEKAIAR